MSGPGDGRGSPAGQVFTKRQVDAAAKAVGATYLAIATEAMQGGAIGFSRTDKDSRRIAVAALDAAWNCRALQAQPHAVPEDVETHRAAWRKALELAHDSAEVSPPDIDDKSYWAHEIRAFDRTFDVLCSQPHAGGVEAGPKPDRIYVGGTGYMRMDKVIQTIQDMQSNLYAADAGLASTPPAHPEPVAWLRSRGWSVAVHNDYRLEGEPHTFWLFTHPSGRWIKGEGRTDAEALAECLSLAHPAPADIAMQTGWLIEAWDSKTGAFGARWWAGYNAEDQKEGDGWTSNSLIAMRFGRERDAQAIIDEIGWTEAKPTEHQWPTPMQEALHPEGLSQAGEGE